MREKKILVPAIVVFSVIISVIVFMLYHDQGILILKKPDSNKAESVMVKPENSVNDSSVESKAIPAESKKKKSANSIDDSVIMLNIITLEANGIERNEAIEITKILYLKILSSKGKERVIYKTVDGTARKGNRTLSGRINKIEDKFVVSVKITDLAKGKVVFNYTERINQGDSLQAVLESLAEKINSDGEVWNRM